MRSHLLFALYLSTFGCSLGDPSRRLSKPIAVVAEMVGEVSADSHRGFFLIPHRSLRSIVHMSEEDVANLARELPPNTIIGASSTSECFDPVTGTGQPCVILDVTAYQESNDTVEVTVQTAGVLSDGTHDMRLDSVEEIFVVTLGEDPRVLARREITRGVSFPPPDWTPPHRDAGQANDR